MTYVDLSKLKGLTSKEIDKQITFAVAKSLTSVAWEARSQLQNRDLPVWLRLTRRWIPSQVRVERATKYDLTAYVYLTDKVPYIPYMEEGGTRHPRGRTISIPSTSVKRANTGGITKANRPHQLLQRKDTFSGTIRGTAGIWQRTRDGRIKLLYSYNDQANYRTKHTKIVNSVMGVVNNKYMGILERNVDQAFRTLKK